jgi:hypothetical protein
LAAARQVVSGRKFVKSADWRIRSVPRGSAFSDVGVFNVYAGTSPDQLDEVLDLSLNELREVFADAVSEEELSDREGPGQLIDPVDSGSSSARARNTRATRDHSRPVASHRTK